MVVTKERLIQFLDENNVKEVNIEISLTQEINEQRDWFITDRIK